MNTVFYIIWGLIPVGYFLLVIWSKLEQSTQIRKGKKKTAEAADLFRQGVFVTFCVGITFLIDYFFVDRGYLEPILPGFVPIGFIKLLLLPLVLLAVGSLVGGSKPIRIEKAPRPTSKQR